MNTLRKLKENWQRPFDGSPEDEYERGYLDASVDLADELSAEIPKWERVIEALQLIDRELRLVGEHEGAQVYKAIITGREAEYIRAALSEVRHD